MRNFILLISVLILTAGCASNSELFLTHSKTAMKAATHDEAVKQYASSAKKNIHSHYYFSGLADIHAHYGYYGEAVNDFTRAIRNNEKAIYHLKRGRSYMKLHFYTDAIVDFSTVINSRGKSFPVSYVERAKAHVEMGDYNAGMKDLDKAKRYGGENTEFLIAMGELHFKMGQYDESKTYIQKAIISDSNNPDLYYLRAKSFYKAKDAHQAIADLHKAISIEKAHLDARRMLAWIYSTNPISTYRDGEKALQLAKDLFAINEDLTYVEVLAAAHAENGQFKEAVEVLKEGIRLSTDLVQKEDFRFDIKTYEKSKKVRVW